MKTKYCQKALSASVCSATLIILLAVLLISSCKKLVEVPAPVTSLNSENVYNNNATATSVLTGIYENITGAGLTNAGPLSLSFYPSLSADELVAYGGTTSSYAPYYTNMLNNQSNDEYWIPFYQIIFTANSAIAGLNSSDGLTPAVKQQLLGEAYFIRGFCYFYLVNLYGDVPLVTSTDPKANALLARTAKAQVYQQIISDLRLAQSRLSTIFLDGTLLNSSAERVRPSKWAAAALLARTYLYYANLSGDASYYTKADSAASVVISNTALFNLSTLSNAFLKASLGNNEAILQMQNVQQNASTAEDAVFIIPTTGPDVNSYPVYLNNSLLNSFEPGDGRLANWVSSVTVSGTTYYFPYKYKQIPSTVITSTGEMSEYEMVLRLGEQYLIRAEARVNNHNTAEAVSDLNVIRTRAGLPAYSGATDQVSLETAILHERQVELFTEWGHRWFDLKRTATVNSVMTAADQLKGATWNSYQQLYFIPYSDLLADPNLKQNPGY